MRQRSANKGDFAGAPGPEDPFAAPPSPQPGGRDPQQRRFDRLFAGITLLVLIAVIGGLIVYFRPQAQPAAKPVVIDRTKQEVEQAYLAYSAAVNLAILHLDSTPMIPFATAAELEREQGVIDYNTQKEAHLSLREDHNYQIVLYSDGTTASVDDNLLQHRVPVEPTTLTPAGPEQQLALHESTVLLRQRGRWLVDSVVGFGGTDEKSQFGLSYAALHRDTPLSQATRADIEAQYLAFNRAVQRAYQTLDPSGLPAVEIDPALTHDTDYIETQRQRHQGFRGALEHNYRVATRDPGNAYVYDTIRDATYPFDVLTQQLVPGSTPHVTRVTVEFTKVGERWKAAFVQQDQ